MESFEELLEKMCIQRIEKRQTNTFKNKINEIIIDFKCWCHSKDLWHNLNEKHFKQYVKENNIDISFWDNKYIYENYFGYVFEYDSINNKWKTINKGKMAINEG